MNQPKESPRETESTETRSTSGIDAQQWAQAEARLREYEKVVEGLEEMIVVVDRDYRYLLANRAFVARRGMPRDEIVGRFVWEVLGKNFFEEVVKHKLDECFTGHVVRYEAKYQYPELGQRDLLLSYFPIEDVSGVERVACVLQDITEHKQAEAALRVSEQKYKKIFSFAPVGIYQSLPDGTIITANRTMATMLGYDSVDELLKLNLERDIYFNPSDRQPLIAEFRHPEVSRNIEVAWKRKDGSLIWVQLEAHHIRNSNGDSEHCEAFVRNVTEQRQAREALRQSEERYRELFENSKDAIYVHDLHGRYTSANLAAEQLTGFTREEIIGKHYSNFIAPRFLKEARENFCLKIDVPIETTYEAEVVSKNGTRTPVEVTSRMIYKDGAVVGVQGTVRDISERKRAEDVLQTYSRRLIEAQEAERQKIARELHDEIGQILTAVNLNLQALKTSCETKACAPRVAESMAIIDEALKHVRELSLELRPSLLDDLGLVAALRWYVARYNLRSGIAAQVTCDSDIGGIPHEVSTACFRIAQEALTNSARHSRATKANVDVQKRNGDLHLAIRDNGIGFDAQLFLNGMASFALGLRGMQERALAVSGRIEVDSQIGQGTKVLVIVPLKK